jgi:hypothetical protein
MILKKGSGVCFTALKIGACVLFLAITAFWLHVSAAVQRAQIDARPLFCDPALTALFTPRQPLLGRYEVCADPRPLSALSSDWQVETLESADAFGAAGSFDRAALARLYRGARAQVARGWTETASRFESTTLVSPYPNARFTQLEPGTLVIRWICDGGLAACKMPNAR